MALLDTPGPIDARPREDVTHLESTAPLSSWTVAASLLPDGSGSPGGITSHAPSPDTYATRNGEDIETIPAVEGHSPTGYSVLERLGAGGMGVVYKARQEGLDRLVALKMIRDESDARPEQLERFRLEGQAVARLRHPNIVQIYEVGEARGAPYFSLELLEGGSLSDRIGAAPSPARASAELLAILARAVHAAHEVGIVHRDLKPHNVLFDRDGTPKVTDFGLAKRLDVEDGLTMTDQVMGTPAYMAPEQALGKNREIGPPADVYALGCILYAMLTGRPPLQGTTWRETLLMVADRDPVSPSRLQPKIPRDLETICLKCLAKEPGKRYASAEALAGDLDRFLTGRPVLARRTPAWERGLKWACRHPTTSALSALALAATIGLVVGLYRSNEARRIRRVQEEARLARLDREANQQLRKGDELRAGGELDEARVALEKLLAAIPAVPRLEEVRRLATDSLADVGRKLQARASRAAERSRYETFVRRLDEALFQDASASALDFLGAPDRTRESSRSALEVFGDDGPRASTDALNAAEREQMASGRLALRLILAGAVARSRPGEDPRRQATEALAILEKVGPAGASTRAGRALRADCLEQAGDLEAAGRERAEADRLAPSDAFDHFLLGRERHRARDFAAAARHLDAALQERPDLFWAQCLSAITALNSSPPRPAEAKAALTSCLQQKPSYAWLRLLRGTAFGQMGSTARARGLREEEAADFDAAEGDFGEALRIGLDGGLRYVLHMNRGVLRFQGGRFEEAADDFRQAAAIEPGRPDPPASLAKALDRLGRRGEALEQADLAVKRRPDSAALYRDRALLRLDRAVPSPADAEPILADLDRAIRLEPPGARAAAEDHARRARLLLRLERYAEALSDADAALGVAPDLAGAHRDRVAALLELGRFAEVIGSTDAALAGGPPTADLHEIRGLARVGRGDFAGAIADYTQALALHPARPSRVLVYRGLAYLTANAPELALADFEEVIRLDPTDPDGPAGRGAARARLRQHQPAVADAEQSLKLGDGSPRRLYAAARIYAQALAVASAEVPRRGRPALLEALGYQSKALALLSQALEKTPADRRVRFWREVVEPDAAMEAIRRRARPAVAPPR
jgi:tetratricopeptide (TPR) repeat protein